MAQNIAIGAALLFLIAAFLRQIPILGWVVRLVMRLVLMVSPVMILVLVVGLVWFHGGSIFSGGSGDANASPLDAPLPTERPVD